MNVGLQKFLALTLTLLALIGFVVLVPVPYVSMVGAKQDEIKALESTLERYRSILVRSESLRTMSEDGSVELNTYFLEGRATSLGVAEIQGLFNAISRDAGIAGGSFRPLPERQYQGVKRVGFRVNFQATTYAFFQLLEGVENNRPLMIPENIKLKAPRDQTQNVDPLLNIQMDVYGLQEAPNGN